MVDNGKCFFIRLSDRGGGVRGLGGRRRGYTSKSLTTLIRQPPSTQNCSRSGEHSEGAIERGEEHQGQKKVGGWWLGFVDNRESENRLINRHMGGPGRGLFLPFGRRSEPCMRQATQAQQQREAPNSAPLSSARDHPLLHCIISARSGRSTAACRVAKSRMTSRRGCQWLHPFPPNTYRVCRMNIHVCFSRLHHPTSGAEPVQVTLHLMTCLCTVKVSKIY